LILCGPTGVGKSWLASALGHKACRDNRSVLYQRIPKLFSDLALARGDGRYARLLRALGAVQLLILDDWGLAPLDAAARHDLLEILEERYGRQSTIITSQIPVDKWHELIGEPTYADAILDRIVHGNLHQPTTPPSSGASGNAAGSKPPGSSPNLPRNWQEIGVGDLVLAQEDPDDGWYEVIVVEVANDMFTLRWRDYPRQRKLVRHRLRLGLLYPGPKSGAETGKSGKPSGHGKHGKTVQPNPAIGNHRLPKDWDEIDVDHLVLAKTEGPWANWFEAIPIERAADGFKLRWRDYRSLSPVIRPRFDLALICPEAG
jgi:IstB-like ATP binding protein